MLSRLPSTIFKSIATMQLRVGRPQLQRLCLALSLAFLFAIIAVAVFSENLAGYAGLSEEYHSLTGCADETRTWQG